MDTDFALWPARPSPPFSHTTRGGPASVFSAAQPALRLRGRPALAATDAFLAFRGAWTQTSPGGPPGLPLPSLTPPVEAPPAYLAPHNPPFAYVDGRPSPLPTLFLLSAALGHRLRPAARPAFPSLLSRHPPRACGRGSRRKVPSRPYVPPLGGKSIASPSPARRRGIVCLSWWASYLTVGTATLT